MQCRLCGSTQVNDLGFGDFWCKECDKYFDRRGEIFYTADGNKVRVRDNKVIKPQKRRQKRREINRNEKRYDVDYPRFMELTPTPKRIAKEAGVRVSIINNIRSNHTKTIGASDLKMLSDYLGVDPKELIS